MAVADFLGGADGAKANRQAVVAAVAFVLSSDQFYILLSKVQNHAATFCLGKVHWMAES